MGPAELVCRMHAAHLAGRLHVLTELQSRPRPASALLLLEALEKVGPGTLHQMLCHPQGRVAQAAAILTGPTAWLELEKVLAQFRGAGLYTWP